MNIATMNAYAQQENVASNRILQKIGMQLKQQYIKKDIAWNWYEMPNPIPQSPTNFK